jgi:hypothetical protein
MSNGIKPKCTGVTREGIDARVTAEGAVETFLLVHDGLIIAFEALEVLVAGDTVPGALLAETCQG